MKSKPLTVSIAGGIVIGALAWIDPLFLPLVLLGPVFTGAAFGWRGVALRYVAAAWAVGGVIMLVSDEIANHEDKAFHAVLTVVMIGLAAGAWLLVRTVVRRRTRTAIA